MAVRELHQGSLETGEDGFVTGTRVFQISTGNAAARPAWGIAGISINRGDPHPDHAAARAVGVSSIPVYGQLGWFEVSYSYSSRPRDIGDSVGTTPGGGEAAVQPDPLLRTPTVKFGQNSRTVPWLRDWSDPRKLIANSANQPFEGQTTERITCTATVSFFLPASTDIVLKQLQYGLRVNEADFSIVPIYSPYPAGYLRCNSYTGTLMREGGTWYQAVEVEFEFNPDGWDRELLDYGTAERKFGTSGYELEKIVTSKNGMPVDGPVPLNGFGLKADTPAVLTFREFRRVSFTNIFAA